MNPYDVGYNDVFEKLGFGLSSVVGRLPTLVGKNVASKGLVAGGTNPAKPGLLTGMWNKAKSYITTKPSTLRFKGDVEGSVPSNIRDDATLAWAKTKELFRTPAPKGLYTDLSGGAHPAIARNIALSGRTNRSGVPGIPSMTGQQLESKIQASMAYMEKLKAQGKLPVPKPTTFTSRTPQHGWVNKPNVQAAPNHDAPTMQNLLQTRKVASEGNMNHFEQGYVDRLVQLGLYKEAGIPQAVVAGAGKLRDLGSRAMGMSKATVGARREAITQGRQAVQAAKEQKMLGGVKDKYKAQVAEIKGPKPPKTQATPKTPDPNVTPKPPEGTEAEGPGSWEKFKGWWGERTPWQKAGIGAGVALPVGAGLFMAGGQNPPSVAQQQYGYQPQL
jgi:hypothetical protein